MSDEISIRLKKALLRVYLYKRLGEEYDAKRIDLGASLYDAVSKLSDRAQSDFLEWAARVADGVLAAGPVQEEYDRASGGCECTICDMVYYDHPHDPRDASLVVDCHGRRWHL